MKTIVVESDTLGMYREYDTCLVMVYGTSSYQVGDKVRIVLSEWDEATARKKALTLEIALITAKKEKSMEFLVLHLVPPSSGTERKTP